MFLPPYRSSRLESALCSVSLFFGCVMISPPVKQPGFTQAMESRKNYGAGGKNMASALRSHRNTALPRISIAGYRARLAGLLKTKKVNRVPKRLSATRPAVQPSIPYYYISKRSEDGMKFTLREGFQPRKARKQSVVSASPEAECSSKQALPGSTNSWRSEAKDTISRGDVGEASRPGHFRCQPVRIREHCRVLAGAAVPFHIQHAIV